MLELTKQAFKNLGSQIVTSSHGGTRYLPMVFTEQEIAMLSRGLNNDNAWGENRVENATNSIVATVWQQSLHSEMIHKI